VSSIGHSQSLPDFTLCGWRVTSEVPLSPDLLPWVGHPRPAELDIRVGRVPDLDDAVEMTPFLQIGSDGSCRLEVASVARYLIQSGCRIVVEPFIDPVTAAIRTFLLGPALGLLCHQRGLFPLMAACLRLGDGAIALAGISGTGKSTLAAALAMRGHALLADDVCVIDAAAPGGPMVLPSFPRLKLWLDALAALRLSPVGLAANRVGQARFHVPFRAPDQVVTDPVPLRAILLLAEPLPRQPESFWLLEREEAAAALSSLIYRRLPAERMGRQVGLHRDATSLAGVVQVIRFQRHRGLGTLAAQAEALEGLAR
jgi:hypothetical protein